MYDQPPVQQFMIVAATLSAMSPRLKGGVPNRAGIPEMFDQKDLVILADNDRAIVGGEGALTEGVELLGLAEPVCKRCEVGVGFGLIGELFDRDRYDVVVVGVLAGVGVVGPGRDDGLSRVDAEDHGELGLGFRRADHLRGG